MEVLFGQLQLHSGVFFEKQWLPPGCPVVLHLRYYAPHGRMYMTYGRAVNQLQFLKS